MIPNWRVVFEMRLVLPERISFGSGWGV